MVEMAMNANHFIFESKHQPIFQSKLDISVGHLTRIEPPTQSSTERTSVRHQNDANKTRCVSACTASCKTDRITSYTAEGGGKKNEKYFFARNAHGVLYSKKSQKISVCKRTAQNLNRATKRKWVPRCKGLADATNL